MTSCWEQCLPRANRRTWREQSSHIVFVHPYFSLPLCLARSGRRPERLPGRLLRGAAGGVLRSADPNFSRDDPWGGHLPWTPYTSSEPLSLSEAAIWRVQGMHSYFYWRLVLITLLRWRAGDSVNECSSLWKNDASQAAIHSTCFEAITVTLVSSIRLRWLLLIYVYNSVLLKVSEVNGNGPTTLSFGSYYGPSQVHGKVMIF